MRYSQLIQDLWSMVKLAYGQMSSFFHGIYKHCVSQFGFAKAAAEPKHCIGLSDLPREVLDIVIGFLYEPDINDREGSFASLMQGVSRFNKVSDSLGVKDLVEKRHQLYVLSSQLLTRVTKHGPTKVKSYIQKRLSQGETEDHISHALTTRSRCKEINGREFLSISPMQYALWAQDSAMLETLKPYVSCHPDIKGHLNDFSPNTLVRFGTSFTIEKLTNAYSYYESNYYSANLDWRSNSLYKEEDKIPGRIVNWRLVGQAQLECPRHFIEVLCGGKSNYMYQDPLELLHAPRKRWQLAQIVHQLLSYGAVSCGGQQDEPGQVSIIDWCYMDIGFKPFKADQSRLENYFDRSSENCLSLLTRPRG